MRLSLPIIIILALMLVGCSQSNKDPLLFQTPDGWKVEHKSPGGLHLYAVTAGPPGGGLLMFSQWPPPSRPEDIPTLVRQLADGFLKQAQQSSKFALTRHEYQIEQFNGEQCEGSYAAFQIGSSGANILQTMFVMSVDGSMWNGQFTGPSNEWAQALTVLKSIRKVD